MMKPIYIDLGKGRGVQIDESSTFSKYRYDMYLDGIIQGSFGLDKFVDDKSLLNSVLDNHLERP